MSTLQLRSSMVRAAAAATVVVALFTTTPAPAQVVAPGTTGPVQGLVSDLITGVEYDRMNQADAERRLQHLQAKQRWDASRGNTAAVNRDTRRINNDLHRIAVDDWLIRKNSLLDPGYYPFRPDCLLSSPIFHAPCPWQAPGCPAPAAPVSIPNLMRADPTVPDPITITIVNTVPEGATVAFAINGVDHQAAVGSRQDLTVAPDSSITYDGGGSLGERRYRLSPGLYEFRSTGDGRALYKLPTVP